MEKYIQDLRKGGLKICKGDECPFGYKMPTEVIGGYRSLVIYTKNNVRVLVE